MVNGEMWPNEELQGDLKRKCHGLCGEEKSITEFDHNRRVCKKCRLIQGNERQRTRRATDPEYRAKKNAYDKKRYKENPAKRMLAPTLAKYGMTLEMNDEQLKKQKYRCPTCTRKFSDTVKIHRDHDHNLGHMRAFLCHHCNILLGMAESTGNAEKTLLNMLKYVRNNELFMSIAFNGIT